MELGLWFHVLGRVLQTKFQFWFSNSVSSQLLLTNPDLNDQPIRNTETLELHTSVAFYQPGRGGRIWCGITNFLTHFDHFAIIFTVWSHILSTAGDALRSHPKGQGSSLHTESIMYYYWPSQHWVPLMAPSELKGEPSRAGHNWHLVLAAWHNGLNVLLM